MKFTNVKQLIIKFMGGGIINFPTRFLRWVKINGDSEDDSGSDDGGGGSGSMSMYDAWMKVFGDFKVVQNDDSILTVKPALAVINASYDVTNHHVDTPIPLTFMNSQANSYNTFNSEQVIVYNLEDVPDDIYERAGWDIRFFYDLDELNQNAQNITSALDSLIAKTRSYEDYFYPFTIGKAEYARYSGVYKINDKYYVWFPYSMD